MPAAEKIREENRSLKGRVRELEGLISNLELKVRALELAKARPQKPDDERQCLLEIRHTESVRIDHDDEVDEAEGQSERPEPKIPSSTTKRKKKKRIAPAEKFGHLPVSEEVVLIPDDVRDNPDGWKEIGETVTHEVLVHPTRLSRRRIVQKKFVSRSDRDAAPIIAKAPIRFSSSYVSTSLAVYIVLNKYLEHGALHRLERKFVRLGADITRQCQSDVVERFSMWMRPLYELIERKTKKSAYLQIDETFIKYINGRKPGAGQGYFWAIHSPGRSMVLKWIDNRRHENVDHLICGFNGILQSDAYAAYTNYAQAHPEITLLACWAHTFRKFREAITAEPNAAKMMMRLIADLYDLEEKWDQLGVSDSARQILRTTESKPIASKIKARLDAYAVDMTIPRNEFREAVGYAAKNWSALSRCLDYGHTRLDTNLLESKFRPTKIGAKNWMFIGHPEAGEKSAVAYTLLNCCRIHQVDPQAYLLDILDKLVPYDRNPPEDLLEALLPENWIQANPDRIIKEPAQA
ncbi:MAG: IS66 family transposase [Puniceicoccaceae bacterium]|nr:MAG: IS66 family transposase [Puniceicoccaceae bacterium]